ncbi:MFS transporter [Dongia sedimenti]|uniref:MFS transporter n=1 Tax=Dongia sedimenti TaxID=3064282 RepID=A0ABU0YUT4_9PROT|nr:MFS transporter [Rhodospirillaceae bacterium R-7]
MSDSLAAAEVPIDSGAEPIELAIAPAWTAVLSLAMGVFGLVTAEFLPASLLTPIAADLGISNGAAGQTVTATAVIGTFAGIFMPILTRHFDRRLVMWALTAALVVSSLLAAFATNLTMLLGARLLLGVGIGGFWSMMAAMAMRLVPERLFARALSIVFTGVSVATVSAAPVGAYLGDLYGWRTVFVLSAGIGVLTLLIQLLTLPSLPPQSKPNLRTLLHLLRRPSIRLVLATILITISGHFAGFTYVRPFLEQVPALKIELISLTLLAYGVAGFFGNLAGGWVTAKSAQASVIVGALIIAVTAFALTGFGAAPWLAGIGVAFWGFAFGFIPVGVQTWIVRAAPDQPEGASGLIVAAFQIAIASGAILGGLIVDSLGPTGVIAYCGLTTLLGAGLVFAFGRKTA